ncbi:MAG: hypothetical protein IPK10_09720 [Bacteroidetes bacterium]|nr:hypothetical protein [Bacteroidota bacterium]
MYLINARAEGDHNSDDDPNYRGAKGNHQQTFFRKPIRSQRCLVIADYFIEGPKKRSSTNHTSFTQSVDPWP